MPVKFRKTELLIGRCLTLKLAASVNLAPIDDGNRFAEAIERRHVDQLNKDLLVMANARRAEAGNQVQQLPLTGFLFFALGECLVQNRLDIGLIRKALVFSLLSLLERGRPQEFAKPPRWPELASMRRSARVISPGSDPFLAAVNCGEKLFAMDVAVLYHHSASSASAANACTVGLTGFFVCFFITQVHS